MTATHRGQRGGKVRMPRPLTVPISEVHGGVKTHRNQQGRAALSVRPVPLNPFWIACHLSLFLAAPQR